MATKDYYNILGVSRTATEKEIKTAYRKLARKYHPDVNPGDKGAEERFKEMAEAYEVLSNTDLRKKYDQFGGMTDQWRHMDENAAAGFGAGGMGGGMGGGQRVFVNPQDMGDMMGGGFADVLQGLLGGRMGGGYGRAQRAQRGEDVPYEVEITLEEAFQGTQRTITLSGHEACPTCRGAGMQQNRPCAMCGGAGVVAQQKTLTVTIPKGVRDGAKVRLAGKGGPGANGGAHGDLFLIPRILPHPRFELRGNDLYTDAPVSFPDAALGAEVSVLTLDGTVTVHIPPGTSSGQALRLKGKGMPHLKGQERGDLYVRIKVLVPKNLSTREKALVEELREIRREGGTA
jgi:molecular chaperone DnaJ